jgi:sulfur transfer complex TusBCD TusB component (DsrH family)
MAQNEVSRKINEKIFLFRKHSSEIEKIEELPIWVKNAITRMYLEDLTIAEAAKRFDRNRETLKSYLKSPAAASWKEGVVEAMNDPRAFARLTLESITMNILQDNLLALEIAKEKQDHNAMRLQTQWLLERPELLGAITREQAPTIVINLTGGGLEPKMIQSSHAEVKVAGEDADARWEE